MLKKTLLILCIIASCMCSTASAASNIIINDVGTKDVKNYILEKIALSHANIIVEQATDNNIVLLVTRTENAGLFGQYTWSYENRLCFTYVQKDKDVILSFAETCTSHSPEGVTAVRPVGSAHTELPHLQRIKGYFNGLYLFGFDISTEKDNGGFAIKQITSDGAFDKAGIKIGDVIIAINGQKLKKDRTNNTIDQLFFDMARPTTQKFLIKRGKDEKLYELTSEFYPPEFKKQ